MNMELQGHGAEYERQQQLDKITNPLSTLEERIAATRQLFPEDRKREMVERADMDSKGRHVRYFRLVTYQELQTILAGKDVNGLDNPHIVESFTTQSEQIKQYLLVFLKRQGIFEKFELEYNQLAADFTFENYRNFVRGVLPSKYLFRLHIGIEGGGGSFTGATGLSSLSAGAPFQPPYFPGQGASNQVGQPVIEMSIPSDEVLLHPFGENLKEMEKEVNTRTIKLEWITDVYNGIDDFAVRFVKDPGTVLYPGYEEKAASGEIFTEHVTEDATEEYISGRVVWDILQSWKSKESILDVIPASKVQEMNSENPKFEKPLIVKS